MRYIALALFFIFVSCETSTKNVNNTPLFMDQSMIIPKPVNHTFQEGEFQFGNSIQLSYSSEFEPAATFLQTLLKSQKISDDKADQVIEFVLDSELENDEAYELIVQSKKITIKAKSLSGAVYAVQSIRQLLPVCVEDGSCDSINFAIQTQTIQDEPRFTYRGMHLDVGRHFFSADDVKQFISMLSLMKMNKLHWHLTEDQGWRIEIKQYPKLTTHAAFREGTVIGNNARVGPKEYDSIRYGGFYTQEEIKDVVAHATKLGVTVIPEIEMPGHSTAAISAYPWLGCTGEQIPVERDWGVHPDIYCPKEETFTFLENVLDEVLTLFPSEYIHIGGDEAPKVRWENCADCQQLIKREGLKDEHELQSYFITRMEKYLNSKGRQIIGWDEILDGGLAPNATVMSWRGISGAIEAAKQNHDVILTPNSHLYFDFYQSTSKEEPLAWGAYLPLERVYSYDPIPEELTAEQAKHVLGAQANLWSEYMPTYSQVEYMAYPRAFALSEIDWSPKESKNYADFVVRVEHLFKRLDAMGVNHANHLYEIEDKLDANNGKMEYSLSIPIKDKSIYYTTDGSEPTTTSNLYTNPIEIAETMVLKAATFNDKEKVSRTHVKEFNFHKAFNSAIEINPLPSDSYNSGGLKAIVNGVNGSDTRFRDDDWLGFSASDVTVTMNLNEFSDIERVDTRNFNGTSQWVYPPKSITVLLSEDGENFNEVKKIDTGVSTNQLVENSITFPSQKAKAIQVIFENYGKIPEGNAGAGSGAWLFIDEIQVW